MEGLNFWGFWKDISKSTRYFSTSWSCPKPWWCQLQHRESHPAWFQKASESLLLSAKWRLWDRRRVNHALVPHALRALSINAQGGEAVLCLLQTPSLGKNAHFSNGGQDFSLCAVRHVPKEAEQDRGLRPENHGRHTAPMLLLTYLRHEKGRAGSGQWSCTVRWHLQSSATEHCSTSLTRAISNKNRAVKMGQ